MPKSVVPYALAHAPGNLWFLGYLWGLIPIIFVIVLVVGPADAAGSVGAFFRRLIQRGRPVPPDRRRWSERLLTVCGVVITLAQTFQTIGLVLYWRRGELPAVAAAVNGGPHFFGYPDPHHWLIRVPYIAGALLLAWFGNGLPKLLNPFKGEAEPYDWGRMMRDCGRVIALGSLIDLACLVFLPFTLGVFTGVSVLAASFLVAGLIWAAYRIGRRPPGLTPPGRTQ
jgi:hypothetical protein